MLLWNLSADPRNNPHTVYAIAHASKFVRPSSYGIGSNNLETLPNVAFQTPEKRTVLIVVNTARSPRAPAR